VAEVKGRTRSETGKAHLHHPSSARIRNQVHEIIVTRMTDRQLDETPLTFADLARIEDAFVRVLVGIFHVRPKYPQITVKG
jgi:membrane-associated HD superfamily phosphohydrolase